MAGPHQRGCLPSHHLVPTCNPLNSLHSTSPNDGSTPRTYSLALHTPRTPGSPPRGSLLRIHAAHYEGGWGPPSALMCIDRTFTHNFFGLPGPLQRNLGSPPKSSTS